MRPAVRRLWSRHMASSYTRTYRRRAFGSGRLGRLPLYWLPGRRKSHWS